MRLRVTVPIPTSREGRAAGNHIAVVQNSCGSGRAAQSIAEGKPARRGVPGGDPIRRDVADRCKGAAHNNGVGVDRKHSQQRQNWRSAGACAQIRPVGAVPLGDALGGIAAGHAEPGAADVEVVVGWQGRRGSTQGYQVRCPVATSCCRPRRRSCWLRPCLPVVEVAAGNQNRGLRAGAASGSHILSQRIVALTFEFGVPATHPEVHCARLALVESPIAAHTKAAAERVFSTCSSRHVAYSGISKGKRVQIKKRWEWLLARTDALCPASPL